MFKQLIFFIFRFDVESKHTAFYTGGNIEWHENDLYCQTSTQISVFDTQNGTVRLKIGDENSEEADNLQTFTTDGNKIVSSHKSGLLKLWNEKGELEKIWKYIHKGPVARLALNGDFLASGGTDGIVRIWDLKHQACVLSLKGCQGVVSVVAFHPKVKILFASGDDGKINSWSLKDGSFESVYSGHLSKVTSLSFYNKKKYFLSSGRDKVIILWELGKDIAIRTIPVYEAVETVICLPETFKLPGVQKPSAKGVYAVIGGESGIIKAWDVLNTKEIFVQKNSLVSKGKENSLSIIKVLFNEKQKVFAVVSAEQNIILHSSETFECLKQFVGFSDEILDIIYFGKNDSHIAIATNSNDIKLYENSNMNCQLLKGHTDLVLALNKTNSNPYLMVSSSKDNTVRLWFMKDNKVTCVGIGRRHTGSVGSVSFPQNSTNFFVSVSQDTCLKLWETPSDFKENDNIICGKTEIAHQKDINCVAISPNDKIIATASQDKTAKLWTDSLTLLGVLRGHKRGVWSVTFSPVDQVVMTSSADCTIKLWSIATLSCLKTFEGHESSVLRASFISNGLQILSAGADGLIKLFNLKTSDCILTLDQHDSRIWAIAVRKDESGFMSGDANSVLIKWKDVTEERLLEKQKEREELAIEEQKLSNYLQNDQLLKALKLGLKLGRPLQVLKIIEGIIKKGESGLGDAIKQLRDDQKESLLKFAIEWNTNSKNCQVAQFVLNIMLNELQSGEFRPLGLAKIVEEALPYTERHFKRLTQLMQDLHFITYTINCMQPHAKAV